MRKFVLFLFVLSFPFFAKAGVVINEIAWMGTENSANDEWIELYSSNEVDLTGWVLESVDGTPSIELSGSISADSFFLLERTDDTTVSSITADVIYTGALSNSGEILLLKDLSGGEVDRVDAFEGWPAGDNITKETMQRASDSSWITATATPKAINASPPLVGEDDSEDSDESQEPITTPPDTSSDYIPPESLPKIKAYAGEDISIITGAEVKFSGIAFGLKNEPLENARFLWSFGDGSSKEGRVVNHIYQFPGNYVVVLNVSSGQYSALDKILVEANKADLYISEAKIGKNGWIEIQNNSAKQVNISGLKIKHNRQVFIFPSSTFLTARSRVVVLETTSGIKLQENNGQVGLYYANSWPIDEFIYQGFLKEGESFNKGLDGVNYIAEQTPGVENFIVSTPGVVTVGRTSNIEKAEVRTPIIEEAVKDTGFEEQSEDKTKDQAAALATAFVDSDSDDAGVVGGSSNWLKWFLASLGIGVLGAAGFLFYRRKTRDEFKVE